VSLALVDLVRAPSRPEGFVDATSWTAGVPTRMLFGADDAAIHTDLLAGWQKHADDMQVELVSGCGHFIADERPDLVAERAHSFF
jgi:pimeloyl-ACP methyl ester carboxylesterase